MRRPGPSIVLVLATALLRCVMCVVTSSSQSGLLVISRTGSKVTILAADVQLASDLSAPLVNNTVRLSNADDIEVYADTVTLLGSLDLAGKQSGSGAGLPGRSIKIVARRLVCGQAPGKAQARCVVDTSGIDGVNGGNAGHIEIQSSTLEGDFLFEAEGGEGGKGQIGGNGGQGGNGWDAPNVICSRPGSIPTFTVLSQEFTSWDGRYFNAVQGWLDMEFWITNGSREIRRTLYCWNIRHITSLTQHSNCLGGAQFDPYLLAYQGRTCSQCCAPSFVPNVAYLHAQDGTAGGNGGNGGANGKNGMLACVGLKSGKARTSLQHRLPAETGREPGESRESNKTGVEQGDMQRKQLTGHASKRVYDWQSGMAHWGETQRYGSMGWPNGSAER
ncbi:expressed protein [Chlorella variabilis]|uniref:Expressed protein n=1 Tax=Chlorella variabilis TaxID=554065 RepID=E1ZPF7_CHLVA|nr:expressed protein [Chlorella variabilis]EFN52267.1 expressed protein [Chlorella variabilis]|eukprot:XP_005844369.1 expressed protein [Chlorella variabilis]